MSRYRSSVALLGMIAFQPALAAQTVSGPEAARPEAWARPSGPYAVTMEEDASLPDHTIYSPADLARLGKTRLPVVAFAGPGCDFNGTAFRPFFTELASNGFLVLVSGPPEPRGGSGAGFPKTGSADLTASIDWAQRAAVAPGRYRGHIDASAVAAMGQSCGGLETLQIAGDPRITTVVLWNSGVLNRGFGAPDPTNTLPAAVKGPMSLGKDALKAIRVPIAYFVGQTDIANPNAADDFTRIDGVPVFFGALSIPGDAHAGTFRQANGGKFGVVATAWLKWRLQGDASAARWFRGAACGVCTDPAWQVRKKDID